MIEKCIGTRKARQLYRFIRHFKVTFLCLLLTIIVLRGTIGAGKFGTPEKDFIVIRNRFSHPRPRNDSLLLDGGDDDIDQQLRPRSSSPSSSSPPSLQRNGHADAHYVGVKVVEAEYDGKRKKWLKGHPKFPSFFFEGAKKRPRVLLVTGSSPSPCGNKFGDYYLLKLVKNKVDYCRLHGIEVFYDMALLEGEFSGFWELISGLLVSHPEVEFIWWMDSDVMFTDMGFEVPWERYEGFNLVLHGWEGMVFDENSWVGLNTGSFLVRNCGWSLDLIDSWGRIGKERVEGGRVLSKDRPGFEADDLLALGYLLQMEKEKWGGQVYLENEYYLQGDWEVLVDRFEEMHEMHQPDFGDHRWPLVTHFVGCKPCGKAGDHSMEKCLKYLEKAFNFGDNQILRMYGFARTSLFSTRVKRLENSTSQEGEHKPAEVL